MSLVKERPPFEASVVSPSRINSYVSCGVAFKMHYVDRLPPTRSGSAALFGNVVHKALETWALDRSADLVPLMRAAWRSETEGTVVRDFISEYEALAVDVIKAEHECRAAFEARTGNPSKAIHMSGEWKKHSMKKRVDALFAKWLPKLDKESPWRFNEYDPMPKLYNESLVLAKKHQARYRSFPNAFYTELKFDTPFEGFTLTGFIDAIEPVLNEGELVGIDVVDYKTYAKPSPEAKDWRQGVFYYVALKDLIKRGVLALPFVVDGELTVPIRVTFDYPRLGTRRHFTMTDGDVAQLLSELNQYRAGVENDVFLPADKGRNPDFCDYPENCCLRTRGASCAQPTEVEIPLAT